MAINWNTIASGESSAGQRQSIYKFILSNQSAVRELVKHLSADEAAVMLDLLTMADARRQGRPKKAERRRDQSEIDAILSI